MLENYINMDYV